MSEHTPAPTPHRAVYGFALYLLFSTLFVIYICWAFIPQYILENIGGLFYLPSKYFALYIPIFLLTGLTVTGFFIYPAINLVITPDIDEISTITDTSAIYRCQFKNQDGIYCDNVIEKSKDFQWTLKKFCNWHKSSNQHNINANNLNFYISNCDCPTKTNCYLREKEDYLTILQNRTKIPPIRDLDISDVCDQIFGK